MASDTPPATTPAPLDIVRLLAASAFVGVAVGLGFEAFETAMHRAREWLWSDMAGELPSTVTVVAITTIGGLTLGVALRLVPGRGGDHPADGHALIPHSIDSVSTVLGVLLVGFIGLVAGASLGPEGAVIPAAAGISIVAGRSFKMPSVLAPILPGAGVAALLAAMFGSPLAGVVPLLEVIPAGLGIPLPLIVLPSLTASAMASITLSVIGAEPAGFLPLGYSGFERGDVLWAVFIGVVVGAVGLGVDRLTAALRVLTRRLDGRNIMLTTTLAGLVLGVIYATAGKEIRFAGIPELLELTTSDTHATGALLVVAAKVVVTSVCLAGGFRGGKIFPIAFIGGASGFALHELIGSVPISVAVGGGLAAALATGLGAPLTAALVAGAVLGPELLPIAVICVVSAYTVHLLAQQLAPTAVEVS